ncbi:unnamed protein product, partial [Mesorhabditis belari]|uniref:Uncharacterized protein n=1 Tax=Mesorhabditis belari TaxID=2138241 RepID=A0AAF3FDY5_9BILA
MGSGSMPQTIEQLLAAYPVFKPQAQKLHCELTGHDLPNRAPDLGQYVQTKKFLTAWEIHQLFAEYPGIFEDLDEKLIGCKLTKTVIARDPKDIRKHIGGQKFKRAILRGDKIEDDEVTNDEDLAEVQEDDEMEGIDGEPIKRSNKRKGTANPVVKKKKRKQ